MKRENVKKYWYRILPCLIILLGIMLRMKGYIANPSFWHDECAMAWNIKFKSYSELFDTLRFLQVTPPFFSVATKLMTKILGYSEMAFRLIPFITGCLSIVGFYFIAIKTLKVKAIAFWALFLFAINQQLINYSFEFKSHGVDVFFTIIALLFFMNLNLEKLNKTKSLAYGTLLATLPWFSFPSAFVIAGGLLNLFIKWVKNRKQNDTAQKIKSILVMSTPLIISGLIYLKMFVVNNYTGTSMTEGWKYFFVSPNPIHLIYLLSESMKFLFAPLKYILLPLILFVWGIIIYNRKKCTNFNIVILSFIVFLVASLLHIYPLAGRVCLFLIPIYLLAIMKPLDVISFEKKIKLVIILTMTFITVWPQIVSVNNFINAKNINRGEYPREMMKFMTDKIKPTDIIYINNASNTEFAYYSSFHNLKENKIIQDGVKARAKDNYIKHLNTLSTGDYWFYLPYDYDFAPVNQWLESWAETQEILYKHKEGKSTLMYVYVK